MKIKCHVYEMVSFVEVSQEIYDCYLEFARKDENLRHEQRRHWDAREFDESATLLYQRPSYILTPEQWFLHHEQQELIQEALAQCTKIQQQRFWLYAYEGLSYAQIAKRFHCSKSSVQESIEAVRKKIQKKLQSHPYDSSFSGL